MLDVHVILHIMGHDLGTTAAYCRGCDYNLTGLPDKHRCPECGREFDRADPRSVRKRPRRGVWKKARWVVYPLLLVVLAGAGGVGWTYWEWKREQPVIAWAKAHPGRWGGGVRTKAIGPDWLAKRAGRWAWLLERADVLLARSDQPVTPADLALSRLRQLTELQLAGAGVGDHLMGEVGRLRELKHLVLQETSITDAGLARLAACRRLESLSLWGSRVGDKGLAPLADHPELTVLNLSNTPVDDRAFPVLKTLTKLRFLNLTGPKSTRAGVAELRKALPGCRIEGP